MFKRHIFGISVILIFLIPLSIGMGQLVSHNSSEATDFVGKNEEKVIRASINHGTPFDITTFSNESHVNLTRTIAVNDWGVVIINDTFIVNITTGFESINSFFSNDIIDKIHIQKVNVINSSYPSDDKLEASINSISPTEENSTSNFHINFDKIVKNATFSIFYSVTDSLTKNKESLGTVTDSTLPYKFSLESIFYPWYSLPLSKYDLFAGAKVEVGQGTVSNTTMSPKPEDVGGEFETIPGILQRSYVHYTLTEINTLNLQSLKTNFGYQSSLTEFIPAFDESIISNMSEDISFDVFFEAALIEFTEVDSTIVVNTWSSVSHTEVITLKNNGVSGSNVGGPKETSNPAPIVLYYPTTLENIKNVNARDSLGNLTRTNLVFRSNEPGYAENVTAIRVVPRFTVAPGEEYTFTLKYEISNKESLNEKEGFLSPTWELNTPLMTMFNWTVRNLHVRIIFPFGSIVSFGKDELSSWGPDSYRFSWSSSPYGLDNIGFGRATINLNYKEASYLQNIAVPIRFSLPPVIGMFLDPLLIILFIFVLGLLIITVRLAFFRLTPVVGTIREKEDIPYDLVEGFVRFYQEKTAIRSRMIDLNSKKKQLKKGDFDKQKQTLESKAGNVDRDLMKYTQSLSDKGGRYRDAVRQIELAEATRDDILRNLIDLDKKKRQKRIRPEIYTRLRDDYQKKLKKANTTIERVLVDLRSLLTERH